MKTIFKYFLTRRKLLLDHNSAEWSCRLSHNKFIEFNVYMGLGYRTWMLMSFDWTFKEDHAGLGFVFRLFSLELEFKAYDHRHWDTFLKTWESCNKDTCRLFEEEE